MLPDYLVDGYDIVSSYPEFERELSMGDQKKLCECLGTTLEEVQSVNWYRYVWSKGYIIYPEDTSTMNDENTFVVLYEDLDNDETVEAVVGKSDYSETWVRLFGPDRSMNPDSLVGLDRDNDNFYSDIRYLLKFVSKIDSCSRKDSMKKFKKSLNEFFKSLDY